MSEFSVLIPGQPPSVNHMYAPNRQGGLRKVEGVETYQVMTAHLVRLARPTGWTPTAHIRIFYDFYLSRKADCDNLQKALNDAIAAALGVNDDTFLPCTNSKQLDRANPRVEVTIRTLDD